MSETTTFFNPFIILAGSVATQRRKKLQNGNGALVTMGCSNKTKEEEAVL